jgi:DNA mismatch repair protein MutS
MEDPRFAKKLVRRELTRVVTPGTATDAALLRSRENNYLAALAAGGSRTGLAYVDVSTGEFRATELDSTEAAAAVDQLGAREVLVAEGPSNLWPAQGSGPLRTEVESWVFDLDYAGRTLREHFNLLTLDGCGLAGRNLAVGAAGVGRARRH